MTTDDFKELCRRTHDALDKRVDSMEGKMWAVIGMAFLQLLLALGWFFTTFIAPKGGG